MPATCEGCYGSQIVQRIQGQCSCTKKETRTNTSLSVAFDANQLRHCIIPVPISWRTSGIISHRFVSPEKGMPAEFQCRLRNVTVVRSGLRAVTYRTCSFTSLGALGSGMSKCINGAAGFLKKRELLADVPRPSA